MTTDEGLQTDWPTEPAGPPPERRSIGSFVKELPVLVVLAFGVALLMKTFLLQMFYIPSQSMEPTLHGCTGCNGDRVAVNKFAYRFREPRRGEVVVFIKEKGEQPTTFFGRVKEFLTTGLGVTTPQETDFIKRVIGLPGETIQVTKRHVFITKTDGTRIRLREPYIRLEGLNLSTQEPLKIPKDHFFVMGDNRNESSDGRVFGPISRDVIVGKAFVKIWPLGRVGLIDVPDYDDARVTPATKKNKQKGRAIAPLPLLALAVVGGARRRSAAA